MKKVKQIFPSRNYITIDTTGDIEIIFNPVGDGFEGDDKLQFRRGRWAFRCNDFLAGKMLPNGENESMNRKIYSLNLVYDTENGEPIVNTTYVDPTSVIPLDGSLVSGNWLTSSDIQSLATIAKQNEIKDAIRAINFSALATTAKQNEIKSAIQDINLHIPYIEGNSEEILTKITEFEKNVINFNALGIYDLLTNPNLPCKRLKCNVMIGFDNISLIFFGADCTYFNDLDNDVFMDFRILRCEKVLANYGQDKFEYFNNIFTKNEFFHVRNVGLTEEVTECEISGVDSNNVFSQIYSNNGNHVIDLRIIC